MPRSLEGGDVDSLHYVQDMLADVYLWVHMNGTKEVISANLTFLR